MARDRLAAMRVSYIRCLSNIWSDICSYRPRVEATTQMSMSETPDGPVTDTDPFLLLQ